MPTVAVIGAGERVEVRGELCALLVEQHMRLGVRVVEERERRGIGQLPAALAQPGCDLVALLVDRGEIGLVRVPVLLEEAAISSNRILELPCLDLVGDPVAGRVIRRRVGAHPVGVSLDQCRTVALARVLQRGLGHGVHGKHVVAVDPHTREAEPARPLVERDAGLPFDRLGDGPLVVLAEEDDGRVVNRGPDEGLVDVALADRAVAEVGNHG